MTRVLRFLDGLAWYWLTLRLHVDADRTAETVPG